MSVIAQSLRQEELTASFYRGLLEDLSDGVYFLDLNRTITYWSPGAEQITGYTAQEVIGRRCADNLLVHSDCEGKALCGSEHCPAQQSMDRGMRLEKLVFVKHKDGYRVPVQTSVRPIVDSDGVTVGAAEVFHVASDHFATKSLIDELRTTALLDPLTGVGNRRLGEKELSARLNETDRYGWTFGVLFVDIDGFKSFNDLHGHEVGDEVLRRVAQTLSHNVRSFDTVSRWGGEEFLLLLRNVSHDDLHAAAQKLRALVASVNVPANSFELRVTISVGATLARPSDDAKSVIRRVDQLMYQSKKQGGDRVSMDPDATIQQSS